MPAINQKDAAPARTSSMEFFVNFCRTVLRPEDALLRDAMEQYARSLRLTTGR